MDTLQAVGAGLMVALSWPALGYLLLGVMIGFVVGLLPGLGGPVAIALMLPFTFGMESAEAFAFLLGMLAVTATTGELTSIIFGVPGEATSAALVLDGHALAKQGQAGRALGASLMSSLVGALFGAAVLAAIVPFVRPIVLSFGSPEFFMLTIVGISFLASTGEGTVFKALISGGLGLMLSMIGMDANTGTARYTFGQLHLWDGLGLVPVTIGLFAVPELLDLARSGTSISRVPGSDRLSGVWQGVVDTFRHRWLVLRCSAIGAIIGILPGLGGAVAQWVTYAHAVQTSGGDRERFGKGAIEGVLGPGSANNSKEGGSLVPTVAFGIPGSVTMAILLGAFIIQGIAPGPDMLSTHLDLTMSFVWMIVLSNVVTVAIGFLVLKRLARLAALRGSLIIPSIMVMVYVGSYTGGRTLNDVIVMMVFGAIGVAMVKLQWARPPLLLGLVLGPLTEGYFFRSVSRYGYSWLARPVVLLLLALCVLVVGFSVWQSRRSKPGLLHPAKPDV